MGMFDHVTIDKSWIEKRHHKYLKDFQTKDFVCGLNNICIDSGGNIKIQEGWYPQNEPLPDSFFFYTIPDTGTWLEYAATIEKGKVTKVTLLVDEEDPDPYEIKQRH